MLTGGYCEELWHGLLDDDFQLAIHSDASFTQGNDIIYWYYGGAVSDPDTHCYYNYISDNPAKGQENWQMRYYPGTGDVTVGKATLG